MGRRNKLAPETRAKQLGNFVLNLGIAALWLLKEPLRFFLRIFKRGGRSQEKDEGET